MHRYSDAILRCAFCERPIGDVQEIRGPFGNTFTGGECACGAVYVFDRSGHNLGDSYVDALTFACGNNAEEAWSLSPETDYEVREFSYDSRRNKFHGASRRVSPTYLFVRVHSRKKD